MASTMEAATSGAIALTGAAAPRQFGGLFASVIPFTFTYEEDSMAAGVASHVDITVAGAEFGDFVLISSNTAVDAVSIATGAFVQAANTVTVFMQNLETSDTNAVLGTARTFNGLILKPAGSWGVF